VRTAGGTRDLTFLLAALGLMVVVTAAMAVLQPLDAGGNVGSSYVAGPDGTKAAYLLLRRLGYQVDRSFEPLTALRDDPRSTLWLVISPVLGPSEGDRAALRRFTAAGGVVVAAGAMSEHFLPDVEWKESLSWAADEDAKPATFKPVAPSALARNAPSIELTLPASVPELGASYLPVYASSQVVGVATAHVGAGRVCWIAGGDPVMNRSIATAHHVQFLLNLMGAPGERRILWDEHYHGHRRSFWSYVARTPLPAGIAQAGLLLLAAVLTFSIKRLPARSVPETPRLAPLEFVDAMGSLYRNAHADGVAVAVARNRLRRLLVERTGLPPNVDDSRLAETAERRLGIASGSIRAVLERTDPAAGADWLTDDALSRVKELQDLARLIHRQMPQ
jgi:hypothetical protein